MTQDLDSLAQALYDTTQRLLKHCPDLAPWRPTIGLQPRLSDADPVTLALMQAMLGHTNETRWLRYARTHLSERFPYPPPQSGYNKRLRKAAGLVRTLSGLSVAFALTGAKADERATLTAMFENDPGLVAQRPGQVLIVDKNHYGRDFEQSLSQAGPCSLRPARKGESSRAAAVFLQHRRSRLRQARHPPLPPGSEPC